MNRFHKGQLVVAIGSATYLGWVLGQYQAMNKNKFDFNPIHGTVFAANPQGLIQNQSDTVTVADPKTKAARVSEIMKFGFPSLTNIRSFNDFIVSYDNRARIPYWVFEHLTPELIVKNKDVERSKSEFHEDTSIHPYFRAQISDYKGSGFDRGHMAAAGNHRKCQEDCDSTFTLSNMAPQVGRGFNRDIWNDLERYCRKLASNNKNVYICTGPLYLPRMENDGKLYVHYQVIGKNNVAVPTHFFKVIVSENDSGQFALESYLMPNSRIKEGTPIETYLCPLEVIERASGLLIFDGIKSSFKSVNRK